MAGKTHSETILAMDPYTHYALRHVIRLAELGLLVAVLRLAYPLLLAAVDTIMWYAVDRHNLED